MFYLISLLFVFWHFPFFHNPIPKPNITSLIKSYWSEVVHFPSLVERGLKSEPMEFEISPFCLWMLCIIWSGIMAIGLWFDGCLRVKNKSEIGIWNFFKLRWHLIILCVVCYLQVWRHLCKLTVLWYYCFSCWVRIV